MSRSTPLALKQLTGIHELQVTTSKSYEYVSNAVSNANMIYLDNLYGDSDNVHPLAPLVSFPI